MWVWVLLCRCGCSEPSHLSKLGEQLLTLGMHYRGIIFKTGKLCQFGYAVVASFSKQDNCANLGMC
jgi:hypothetical protein